MNTLEFYSIIIFLQSNCSVCDYVLYMNKHIIIHLTEVPVSYIGKFNVLLVHRWNCCRDNFNVCSLLSLVEIELGMSFTSGAKAWKPVCGYLKGCTDQLYVLYVFLESRVNHRKQPTYFSYILL